MTDKADIVIINGDIITLDDDNPQADALVIIKNRIAYVGSNDIARQYIGKSTKVLDTQGATVLPGFNESHLHIFAGALSLTQLSLHCVHARDHLQALIDAYAAANSQLPLLVAYGADYFLLGEDGINRHKLDALIGDRPLAFIAGDHHTAWANTAALQAAGILYGRDLGADSSIVMGSDGLATGELLENEAMSTVLELGVTAGRERLGITTGGSPNTVSAAERAQDRQLLEKGLAYCASNGITSIQNMDGNLYQLELLDSIEQSKGLPVRVRMPFHFKNFMSLEALSQTAAAWRKTYHSNKLICDFIKMFADGVVESGTACLVGTYADTPDENGKPLFDDQLMNHAVAEADRLGFQVAVHAVGSGAVRQVLNSYEYARSRNGKRDSRHRIEHIETIAPIDIGRFRELGVVASMQPTHAPGTSGLPLEPYLTRIGKSRWPYAFAWRYLAETGAMLVYGTDWPITPLSPLACIEAALIRKPWAEGLPDHRLAFNEVLRAYTKNGAWVEFRQDQKGCLKKGYWADAVILSDNLEKTEPHHISNLGIVTTICDGTVVYQA